MLNQDPLSRTIEAVLNSPKLNRAPWTEFSLVAGLAADGWVNHNFGYSFAAGSGPNAFSAKNRQLQEPLQAYLEGVYLERNYPIRVLLQFNRESGRHAVEFEDSDVGRWQVTPSNLDEAREALRPNLG